MSEEVSRDPGEEYLSCVECEVEWDDVSAVESFGDCPVCGGESTVIQTRVFEVGSAADTLEALTGDEL